MRSRRAIWLVVLGLVAVRGPAAAAPGEAKGELVVAGKATPLAHAYAVPQRDGETLLILTDEPLSEKAIKDVFERLHLSDDGKLHAVEMILDSKKIPMSVSIRHDAFHAHGGGFSSSEHSSRSLPSPTASPPDLSNRAPANSSASPLRSTRPSPRPSGASAVARSAARRQRPQAKVAVAFFKAGEEGRRGRRQEVRRLEPGQGIRRARREKAHGAVPVRPGSGELRSRVDVEGDTAEVSFETKSKNSTETSTVKLKLENGKWKVSP
jgi:hypothetical protein